MDTQSEEGKRHKWQFICWLNALLCSSSRRRVWVLSRSFLCLHYRWRIFSITASSVWPVVLASLFPYPPLLSHAFWSTLPWNCSLGRTKCIHFRSTGPIGCLNHTVDWHLALCAWKEKGPKVKSIVHFLSYETSYLGARVSTPFD